MMLSLMCCTGNAQKNHNHQNYFTGQEWPKECLEPVKRCPVCGADDKKVMHPYLTDDVFQTPGKWHLFSCLECACAHLDPRPTQDSICRAYDNYYTHSSLRKDETMQLNGLELLRRKLANGYLNARYGTRYLPASKLGPLIAWALPSKRESLDLQYRWLPKAQVGHRLLDVGCGNGSFLLKAKEAGWRPVGLDPDPKALVVAQRLGQEVYLGSIEVFDKEIESFDAVTLSHVIEHVPDPLSALSDVYRLLKPGGTLYIQTPNIQSGGSAIFGPNWRGIEAPRHLVLFSTFGLHRLLQRIGFKDIELKSSRTVSGSMFLKSYRISQGLSPYSAKPKCLPWKLALRVRNPFQPTSRQEYISLIAKK